MAGFDLYKADTSALIIGALLAIVVLLMFLVFGKKPQKQKS